jgi:heterotetrameric sarcosine oxidase gamma subunit
VSGPELPTQPQAAGGVRLHSCQLDVIELCAYVAPAADARRRVAGLQLPSCGHFTHSAAQLTMSVRPGRWLILSSPLAPGAALARWQLACADQGAVVELSSALSAFALMGARAAEVLLRGCRLDLDPATFQHGRVAATLMAQVAVTLALLPSAVLLLTPSSTAQHLREWLAAVARPFGLAGQTELSFAELCGARSP